MGFLLSCNNILVVCSVIKITDAGDVPLELSQEDSYKHLTEMVERVVSKGGIPFVVGGGNDESYPNACGLMNALGKTDHPYDCLFLGAVLVSLLVFLCCTLCF